MRIFVTGATGYIGFHVASALRRAGHEVWGLVRSEQGSLRLQRQEIRSVIGNLDRPDSYLETAATCSVLVHAAMESGPRGADLDRTTVETLILAGNRAPQPKTLIYTSGVWVYGNTGREAADEKAPLSAPRLVQWRPLNEQRVLSAASIRAAVVRPGCLYGKQGGLTASWFAAARKGEPVSVVGDGSNYWTMVHAEDLADGYLRLIESERYGEIFNFTDRSRCTVGEMARAASRAAGSTKDVIFVPREKAAQKIGDYAECLTMDQHVDSRKAVRLLGWQPRHGGFIDGVDAYFLAWSAHAASTNS